MLQTEAMTWSYCSDSGGATSMGIRSRAEQVRGAVADAVKQRAEAQRLNRFASSPVGQARSAFEHGAELFQVNFSADLSEVPFARDNPKAGTLAMPNGPTQMLSAIRDEGWEFVTGSFVFESNGDLFGTAETGYSVNFGGTTVGYYVFRRAENLRVAEVVGPRDSFVEGGSGDM